MADISDNRAQKQARSEFSRHGVDMSRANFRMSRGILHIGGIIQIPGRTERRAMISDVEQIARSLKSRPEIRDVIVEASYQN